MENEIQGIRRSEFVYSLGPGAIFESVNGSRLIPSLKGLGVNCNDYFFTKHEIQDVRMSNMLNQFNDYENHLLEIPANASIQENDFSVRYSTVVFPSWNICHTRFGSSILYFNKAGEEHCDAYNPELCKNCDKDNNPSVRFIKACPDGHMDDIYWEYEVHNSSNNCGHKTYFLWNDNTSRELDIQIECPKCHAVTTMGKIIKRSEIEETCTARLPERESIYGENFEVCYSYPKRDYKCTQHMSVINKMSSSLRIPITKTLLKIPHFDEPIMDSFVNNNLRGMLACIKDGEYIDKEEFKCKVRKELSIREYKMIDEYLKDHEVGDLIDISNRIGDREPDFSNSINEEFYSLKGTIKDSANFSKKDFVKFELKGLDFTFPLDVCPITKITTVTAQLYYQRKPHSKKISKDYKDFIYDSDDNNKISVGYVDEKTKKCWYPAFKGVGEGIFLTSELNPLKVIPSTIETAKLWSKFNPRRGGDREEMNMVEFVWWHTLSHALIKSLSLSCGYNSASLRERVYVDKCDGKGGILIYNTSPGDDSGMGGLVDLVYDELRFEKVLGNAINTLLVCSNDPLCAAVELEENMINGAVCHNCLLLSETSCEHHNELLDRHFFI